MNTSLTRPVIGITMGDPAGIGPEILSSTLADPNIHNICHPVIIGDTGVMKKAFEFTGTRREIVEIDHPDQISNSISGQAEANPGRVHLIPGPALDPAVTTLGAPTPATGKAMENYILTGVDLASTGAIQALVTAPITKTGLKLAGSRFHGHTELIAHNTGTKAFAMMLAGERLKVVLVTIHMPLAEVPRALTPDAIVRIIRLTHDSLRERFGINNPRIAVAGLNPHAGEEGMFGQEESEIIVPALETARKKGLNITGPLPPDTVFFSAVNGNFDAVVCMYHDQGLIPFKMVHFKDGVNTTLGLPIIRTSVDHGTAYDIAWQGKADDTSMKEAVKMAVLQSGHLTRFAHGQ
ncbi:MAG: 4-hydroxythreonine-4-phosphate dehydrogenase PdxA [Desulfobacterales bacterium]|nr:4-hydroxythreonine-4-phosphate dehydrogenase PdxA [Desulfobacterales bacterium]